MFSVSIPRSGYIVGSRLAGDPSFGIGNRMKANRMSDEEINKLRKGDRPFAREEEEFHCLPAPLIEIPRPR